MLFSTTNSFANISSQGYPILALFVLIDRTTCQLIKKSVAAPGGGALRCFRYRVCAAGQGIVFTILAPEPAIFFCKNAPKRVCSFQIFAPGQDYNGNFAPWPGYVTSPKLHWLFHSLVCVSDSKQRKVRAGGALDLGLHMIYSKVTEKRLVAGVVCCQAN